MTGKEFAKLLDDLGMSQTDAATALKVSRQTICSNISKDDERVSLKLARAALEYSCDKATENIHASFNKWIDLSNRLYYESRVGTR